MAGNYSQIYLHFVFAVKGRQSLIPRNRKEDLHRYITGVVQNRKSKLLAIHCMPDHIHLLVGFNPGINISDFVKEIKVESNEFIRKNKIAPSGFAWQSGYGVFSYSKSQIGNVIAYIENQEFHHAKKSFLEEYREFLDNFQIQYDPKYLFTPIV